VAEVLIVLLASTAGVALVPVMTSVPTLIVGVVGYGIQLPGLIVNVVIVGADAV